MAFWKRSRHRATDLRIGKAVERPLPASVIVDGQPLSAFEGESVAAALLAAGVLYLRGTGLTPSSRRQGVSGGHPEARACLRKAGALASVLRGRCRRQLAMGRAR